MFMARIITDAEAARGEKSCPRAIQISIGTVLVEGWDKNSVAVTSSNETTVLTMKAEISPGNSSGRVILRTR
jgi:hypothetical protein